jgi:MFS family permease
VLSLVTVVFGVGRLLADVPAGRLADRVPPLRVLGWAAVALGAGSLLLGGAHSLALVLVAAAVLGAASSVTNTTGMAFFSRGPVAGRGTSLAVFSAALLGGQALGPGVSGIVSAGAGWRLAEIAAAGAAAAVAVGCLLAVSPAKPQDPAPGMGAATWPRPPRDQLALLYAVSFAVFFALGAMPQTLLPVIGEQGYGLSVGTVGLLLGLGGLCRFAGAWVGGAVSDRRSRKIALVPSRRLRPDRRAARGRLALRRLRHGRRGGVGRRPARRLRARGRRRAARDAAPRGAGAARAGGLMHAQSRNRLL